MALSPTTLGRLLGASRIAVGVLIIAVPERVGEGWLGDAGTTPAAGAALRGLGARDVLIGMAVAHTAGDRERGYRWARTSALGDLVDLAATVSIAKHIPRSGLIGTSLAAGGAAVASVAASRYMQAAR